MIVMRCGDRKCSLLFLLVALPGKKREVVGITAIGGGEEK